MPPPAGDDPRTPDEISPRTPDETSREGTGDRPALTGPPGPDPARVLSAADPGPDLSAPDPSPGLPGIASWPAMYGVVLGTFVLWDVLLTSLSWFFP